MGVYPSSYQILRDRNRALEAELDKSRDNHAEAFRLGAEAMRERNALKAEVERLKERINFLVEDLEPHHEEA